MPHLIPPAILPYVISVLCGVVIVGVFPLVAGYIVLAERKLMADMQARLGPMRVGPHGLLQPIADAFKLMLKEDIIPAGADKFLFWIAPVMSVTMALLAFAAIPIGPAFQIADLNVGLLFILAVSSLGIYGIVLGGWASNSHYSLLGALRSAAQLVSYETAAGLGLVSGLLLAGSLSLKDIVQSQADQGIWFIFAVPIGFFIYLVGSIAETNRAPFDLPEAESELVAGFHTEYASFKFAMFFIAEYTSMITVSALCTIMFFGGWLSPFPTSWTFTHYLPSLLLIPFGLWVIWDGIRYETIFGRIVLPGIGTVIAALGAALLVFPAANEFIQGPFWLLGKILFFLFVYVWLRGTLPRFRYDQLMSFGWKLLLPVSIANVVVTAFILLLRGAK